MARFILVLLIALLPMRGWSTERMAVEMASNGLATSQTTAHITTNAEHGMPADCPMVMAHADAAAGDPASPTGDDNRVGCHACQLCMSLLALEVPSRQALSRQAHPLHATHADRFASADLARVAKPPIH